MSERLNRNLQQAWWTVFPILLASWFAVRLLVGAILVVQPKLYEGVAVLDESPAPPLAPGTERQPGEEACLVLAERLDLPTRWKMSAADAAATVRTNTVIRRSDHGPTTEIICRHPNASDARDIAAHLARTYSGWLHEATLERLGAETRRELGRREELRRELAIARQHVREWNQVALTDELTARAIRHVEDHLAPAAADEELVAEVQIYRTRLQHRDLLESELGKLDTALARLSVPPSATVTLLQSPEVAMRPVSPNVPAAMLWAGVVGILTGFLAWWLYMARLRKPLTPEQIEDRRERARRRNAADY